MKRELDWPDESGWWWVKYEWGSDITSACRDDATGEMLVYTDDTGGGGPYEEPDMPDFYNREYFEKNAGKAKFIRLEEECPFTD